MSDNRIKNNMPAFITGIYIALMLTLFLLWFDGNGYRAITAAKLPVFYILSGAYIVAVLVAASIRKCLPKLKDLSAVQWLIIAYLLLTLLSAMCSPKQSKTWIGATRYEGAITISIYCLSFLLISLYGRAEKWLLWPLGAGVTALCIVCIIQLFGYNPFKLYPKGLNFYGAGKRYIGQYLGTVGNTGLLAAFFSIVIPVMWVSILRLRGKKRFALLLPLVLSLLVLVKMNVAAGIAGVVFGGALSLPLVVRGKKKRRIIALLLLAALVCVLAFLYLFDIGAGTLHEAHEILHGNISDSFGSSRIYIWKNVLSLVPDRLLLGAGPDTLALADIKPFTRYDADMGKVFTAHIDTAHNEYLNVLYHQGIFALAAYLGALIVSLIRLIKQSEKNTAAAIMGTAVLCYCIQAFFGISMFITAPYFWISLGLLESSYNKKPKLI